MAASVDAVSSQGSGRPLPWLLTATVIVLIYQQAPMPQWVPDVKAVLPYALWVLGTLLMGQFLRQSVKRIKRMAIDGHDIVTLGWRAWRDQQRTGSNEDAQQGKGPDDGIP